MFWKRVAILILLWSHAGAAEVVLITGASRGIGRETATLLAENGYIVYAGVRSLPPENSKSAPLLHWIELEVTDQESVDRAVKEIIQKEGRIDVVVNNAAIFIMGTVENLTIEEAQKLFDVNFFGAMRVSQAVLPYMRESKKGKILQISSRAAFRPTLYTSFYAATKSALESASESMAISLKPWNIQVSIIEPGPVNTDMLLKTSPYGSRLARDDDPYYSLIQNKTVSNIQEPLEIALIIKEAIEAEKPHFRYQTTESIRKQAAKRMVDVTGNSYFKEWEQSK